MLFGFALNAILNTVNGVGWKSVETPGVLAFGICIVVAFGLQIAHSFGQPWRWPPPARVVTTTSLAIAVFAPALWIGPQSAVMVPLLAASILSVVSGPSRWLLFVLVCLANGLLFFAEGLGAVNIAFVLVFTAVHGLAFYGLSFLAALAEDLENGRTSLGRIAAAGERVRIARDLHDVVGHDLLAFTLKCELAQRLLPGSPARAEQEMSQALLIARRATAALRMIPVGDQELSLADEVSSIASVLSAAQIEARMDVRCYGLPDTVDSVLAIVLREAITNVLRHSKARRCEVEGYVLDGRAQLRVGNDEVAHEPAVRGGSGLDNLAARLVEVGGRLNVQVAGGWLVVTAEVPLPQTQRQASASPSERDDEFVPQTAFRWAPGAVDLVTSAVLLGYIFVLITNILWRNPAGMTWGVGICLAALAVIQFAHTFLGPRTWPAPLRVTTLSIQAAASFVPVVWVGATWGAMGGFLAGSILLVLHTRWRWALYLSVGGAILVLAVTTVNETALLGYLVISTLQTGLVLYGLASLSGLVTELHATRNEIVRLAVTRERLGAARKVNDLLNRDLSTIMHKCGMARAFIGPDPERTQEYILEALDAARRLVAEVRSTASGYRHVSLAAEADSTRAALSAAGIEARIDISCGPLPQEADVTLAMVLRDAVTDMVQLSGVRQCEVAAIRADDMVRLRISHERATQAEADAGTLEHVGAHLKAVGGGLRAETMGTWFHLTAETKLRIGDREC